MSGNTTSTSFDLRYLSFRLERVHKRREAPYLISWLLSWKIKKRGSRD